jgi:predicted DNA-binding transcriptional regulator YafY
MRRADRLFRLVQVLRRQRVSTARQLAGELRVSERTVYRDVADLVASGVPIRGEAGVGYALDAGYDLPPLMFTVEEIEALVLGARMVETWCDVELAAAARDVLAKVEGILPRHLRERFATTALVVPDVGWSVPGSEQMMALRAAIRDRRKVRFDYRDAEDRETKRIVRPLGILYWGSVATLAAWCELRLEFRTFRVDRILEFETLAEGFESPPGRTLEDYLRAQADNSGEQKN